MRAAIYARKSTEQRVAEEAKSVTRQIEGARKFITSKGWTIDDAHVYADDGISGAVFLGRPEFQRLLRDAEAHAFDIVVFFDIDRFGRYGRKTMQALWGLDDLGVAIWDYAKGAQLDLTTFEGQTTAWIGAGSAESYRTQVRKHTRAGMRRNVEQHGSVVGNPPFGYRAEGPRGQKRFAIDAAEARIVREIFARYAAGQGARSIARALNAAKAPSPRAQGGRPSGWSVSTIRAVLDRDLYRGEYVYGKTAKAYHGELKRVRPTTTREKGQIPTDPSTWVRIPMPELAIIDAKTIAAVDARRVDRRDRYKASLTRATRAPEKAWGKYLLSGGMLVCPACGGHFEARKHPWKGAPKDVYVCGTARRKPGACASTLALSIDVTDEDVLSAIERDVLDPRWIDQLVTMVEDPGDNVAALTQERADVQAERDRLVGAIAKGVPAESVATAIREAERRLRSLDARLRAPREPIDRKRLRAALTKRSRTWKADLRREPAVARLVLRRLIGPITLDLEQPPKEWVAWQAMPRPEGLLSGINEASNWVASPPGFEPGFQP